MNQADREALARAREVLENPGLAVRLTDLLGRPVEAAVAALPAAASRQIRNATSAALQRALAVALRTLDADPDPPADWLHRLAAGAAGAGGGAFGLAGLAVELPLSTGLMLRAIADHARAQGEDLSQPAARLECLAVFAYGSPRAADDAARRWPLRVGGWVARLLHRPAGAFLLVAALLLRRLPLRRVRIDLLGRSRDRRHDRQACDESQRRLPAHFEHPPSRR